MSATIVVHCRGILSQVEAFEIPSDGGDLVGVELEPGVKIIGPLAEVLAVVDRAHEQLLALQAARAGAAWPDLDDGGRSEPTYEAEAGIADGGAP